jgi:signal transduction histidine kinase
MLELLRDGDLSPEQSREFVQRVSRETERISHIIRDLLDFARRDAAADSSAESSDLREVVDDAVSLVRPQKDSRDVAIEVAIDPATGPVIGSKQRLTQILLNLLLNAVDALQGSGRIEVRAEPNADRSQVTLSVSDTGPGIARDMLDKLFEPFTTTKPAGEGTGLGLAVTHAIVEGLGGSIRAENRREGGARFTVQLRAAQSA